MENRPNEHPELSNEEIERAARMEEEATASPSKEMYTIEIDKVAWNILLEVYFERFRHYPQINKHYTIKEIKIIDDFFKNDERHSELKKAANKAYKELKNYEFDKRNK